MYFSPILIITILFITGCTTKNSTYKQSNSNINTPISTPTPIIIDDNSVVYQKKDTKESIELKRLMRKFDYIIFTKVNSEVEDGEEGMFFGKNTQKTLKEFIDDIDKIKYLYPDSDEEYFRLTSLLKDEVTKLYKIIKIKKMDWVKPQLNNIIDVCNECHNYYNYF